MTATTTKINDANNTKFVFRNKFEKLLNDANRDEVTSAFEYFCNYSRKNAKDLLWEMTYSEESAVAVLEELALDGIFPEAKIPALRNELRYQYQERDAEFLQVSIPAECQEAYDTLVNHSGNVVAYVVYCHCQKRLDIEEGLDRILFLLKSQKEENYFGGIRSLRFNMEEATYLKPFHMQIHNLLEEMYKVNKAQKAVSQTLAVLEKPVEEAGVEVQQNTEKVQEADNEAVVDEYGYVVLTDDALTVVVTPETSEELSKDATAEKQEELSKDAAAENQEEISNDATTEVTEDVSVETTAETSEEPVTDAKAKMLVETRNETAVDEATVASQDDTMDEDTMTETNHGADKECVSENSEEKSIQAASEFTPLTPENILVFKEEFATLVENCNLNFLVQIGEFGFDLNEVMAKIEKIKTFLEAAEALSSN